MSDSEYYETDYEKLCALELERPLAEEEYLNKKIWEDYFRSVKMYPIYKAMWEERCPGIAYGEPEPQPPFAPGVKSRPVNYNMSEGERIAFGTGFKDLMGLGIVTEEDRPFLPSYVAVDEEVQRFAYAFLGIPAAQSLAKKLEEHIPDLPEKIKKASAYPDEPPEGHPLDWIGPANTVVHAQKKAQQQKEQQ